MSYAKLVLVVALTAVPAASIAQTPASSSVQTPAWQQQAADLEKKGDFEGAIRLYRNAAEPAENPVPTLIQLARLQRLAGDPDSARATYEDVLRRTPNNPRAMLGMTIVETLRGNLEDAERWLARAVTAGVPPKVLEKEAELAPLRSRETYRTQLELATRLANPCRHEPEFAAFDFWIGDWDIYVNGQPAGRNLITREMNGCIIHERAELASGYRGESLNYYDPLERLWKQAFVSNGANVIHYSGRSPRAGLMEMNGTSVAPGSTSAQLQRVVWELLPDGSVTHTVRVSNDDGRTWSQGFSGHYRRTNRTTPTRDPDSIFPYNNALSRPADAPL